MKKWLAAILTFVLLAGSLVSPQLAHAQAGQGTIQQAAPVSNTNPGDGAAPTGETRVVGGVTLAPSDIIQAINAPTPNLANTTAYVFYTLSVLINGTFDPNHEKIESTGGVQQTYRPNSINDAISHSGAVGGVGYLIGQLVNTKPVSAQTYVADALKNSRFGVEPAYAQGIGFAALSPVLGTWKAFRDVAYYLLTAMFMVTGILILIRHKISGNMAVTVQNALPRLVMTLIFITFSYAIAGFVVDIMFLVLNFIVNIFESQIFANGQINPAIGSVRNLAFNTHLFQFMTNFIFGMPGSNESNAWMASRALGDIVYSAVSNAAGLGGILAPGQAVGNFFSGILQLIFALVFGIALLIAMFRVFFALLMSYAGFVINVVLSPLILLQGAIPGRDPFKDWIKNLAGGLAPFVVTVFMILMSLALTGANTRPGIGYDKANPGDSGLRLPLILAGQIPAEAFLGILGMGFMLLLPEAVNISKKMVGSKGGPFDELKDKAVGNFKEGWKGNGYIGGKGIAQGAGRFAAGAAIGSAGAGATAYNAALKKGSSQPVAALKAAGAGVVGGLGGGIALTGLPLYQKGVAMGERGKKYSDSIDEMALAAKQFNLNRRAENDIKDVGTNAVQPANRPAATPAAPVSSKRVGGA